MKIAILIGVSHYINATALPGCKADVENMGRLLTATNQYSEIVVLATHTTSSPLKDALRGFFAKYQGVPDIEEVFVYFSGHGLYHTDALLCCSDFDPSRPATTSISNAEIDDLLRSIGPKVAVKVIDACQSGSPYIKDASAGFEKSLRSSRLTSFICMASSRQDQSSYASADESYFTKHWIDAALYKTDGTVLYRDIQAALADAFANSQEQTPFFVNQGTGLEALGAVTDEMKRLASVRFKSLPAAPGDDHAALIAAEIARLDERYVSFEDAKNAIERAGTELDREPIIDPIVSRFYDKRVSRDAKFSALPNVRSVAEFAQEQGWSKKYFVEIKTRNVQVRVPKDPMSALFSPMRRLGDDDYIFETRTRPNTLESTQSLPFEVAEVAFEARNPSLKSFRVYIGIVHSLTSVMSLSAVVQLTQKSWTERSPELSDVKWRYQSHSWKELSDSPRLIWEEALQRGQEQIKTYLESFLPKKDEPAAVEVPNANAPDSSK